MLPVQTRVYEGRSRDDAAAKFNADAAQAWQSGYAPVTQDWKGPNWLPVVFMPLILFVIVYVLLPIFLYAFLLAAVVGTVYAIAARPVGRLTVTYALRA